MRKSVTFFFCCGSIALLHDFLFLDFPIVLYFIVHLHCGIFIYRNDHALAEKSPARKMVRNITRNFIQPVVALDNLQNTRGWVFEQTCFVLIQVFIFNNIHNVVIEKIIFQPDFFDAPCIIQRNGGAVLDRLRKIIFRDVIAEPLICQPLGAEQRRAGKRDVIGVRQSGTHILRQILILRSVRFIHHHNNIVARWEHGIFFALVIAEFMYQRKDKRFVGLQILTKLFAVLGLTLFLLSDNLCADKVFMNLVIQILSVGDNQKAEIAF